MAMRFFYCDNNFINRTQYIVYCLHIHTACGILYVIRELQPESQWAGVVPVLLSSDSQAMRRLPMVYAWPDGGNDDHTLI